MRFNEKLLKSRMNENLNQVSNPLDREAKANSIVEALNFFDTKSEWVDKLNRDEIISLITNSETQDQLIESICEKVNKRELKKFEKKPTQKKSLKESKESTEKSKNTLKENKEKVQENKTLMEGPGAGYEIKGTVTNLHDIEIIDTQTEETEYEGTNKVTITAKAKCDIVGVQASSYYYGRNIVDGEAIPCDIELKFNFWDSEFTVKGNDMVSVYDDDFEFDAGVGGGWSHYTFDGVIEGDYHDVENDPYGCDTEYFKITILNDNVIKDIDMAVTGDDWEDEYQVFDENDDLLDGFETEDEAIEYAKANKGTYIIKMQWQIALMSDFESQDFVDEYNDGIVWEREYSKNYKYDEGLFESKFDLYVNNKYICSSDKYKTSKNFKDKVLGDGKVKYAGKRAIETSGVEQDEIEIKPEDKVKVKKAKRENLKESDYIGNAKIINSLDELPKVNDQYGYKDNYVISVDKTKSENGYDIYTVKSQEKEARDNKLGDDVDVATYTFAIKQENLEESKSLKESDYYNYLDKDYADFLDSDVNVYDVKALVEQETNGEYTTHYSHEYAIIVCANGKGCVVDYEAVGQDFDSVDSEIEFGIVENKDNEYTDENGTKHKTISLVATHRITTTPKEVMEKAPKKTMKVREFFSKYKYNDRCADNFKELAGYVEKNNGVQESCQSKKKNKKLKEGYIGQTLQDFLDDCIDYYMIDKIYIYGNDDIVYEGSIDDIPDDILNAEFLECEMYSNNRDMVVINVDSSEDYGVTTYYNTVEDFVEDCNNDTVVVWDIATDKEVFRGYRDEIPDDVLNMIFCSYDTPSELSVNLNDYEPEDSDFDDEDDSDFDESLKQYKTKRMNFRESFRIDKSKLLTEKKKSIKEALDSEAYNKLANSNVDYEYGDYEGDEFFIFGSWDDVREAQKILAPDYEPTNDTDTTKIDELLNNNWGFRDEYDTCYHCGKIVNTQPYGRPDFVITEYELLCNDCAKESEEYLQSLINNPKKANTVYEPDELEDLGFTRLDNDYENGLYDRVDDPTEILNELLQKYPEGEFIFNITSYGNPFATYFEVWGANMEENEDEGTNENLHEDKNEDVQTIKDVKVYYEDDGEPLLVFKSISNRNGGFDAYSHNGQHTSATKDYLKTLKKANKNDQKVKDLVKEYESNYQVKLSLKEDTVKQDGKWVNKGNTGETHGTFKTKKEADKQRKAMFVNKKPNAKWGK